MLDDAIQEARRLLASLRSMRAEEAITEAELLLSALEHDEPALEFASESLERIDARLPEGALAGFVQVRLKTLAGMIDAMLGDMPAPPPPAA